jgi:uncharacterized surface protein with fasciclin (FAS1) repeats
MKKSLLISKLSLLSVATISFLFVISSCKPKEKGTDDVVPTVPTKNIYEMLSATNYSKMKAAVDKAGMADLFKGTATYTLYVPSDDAFLTARLPNFDAFPASEVEKFVKLHMMSGIKNSLNIGTGGYTPTFYNGGPSGTSISAFTSVANKVMSVNGRQVIGSQNATNGIVHNVTDLLVWYDKSGAWRVPTVYDLITFTSLLTQYKIGVDLETATTKTYFSGPDLYTALATDNEGLQKYFKSVERTFTSLKPIDRRRILDNSTVSGNLRSASMTSGTLATKMDNLKILVSGSSIIINDSVSVILTDGQGVNGVIQIIDKPLNY